MAEVFIYILHLSILFFISFFVYNSFTNNLKNYYWPGLILKLLSGIIYGLIYKYYFGYGDTFQYFKEGIKIANLASQNVTGYFRLLFLNEIPDQLTLAFTLDNPRAFWMSKAISPLLIITNNNYWLSACYLSLFSFLGIFYLSQKLVKIYPAYKLWIIISFFFFPTFVLWSSGLTKESFAIGSLFFMIAVCFSVVNSMRTTYYQWALFILLCWIEWQLRFFYLAAFLATFFFYIIIWKIYKGLRLSGFSIFIIASAILLLGGFLITHLDYTLGLSRFPEFLVHSNQSDYNKNPSNSVEFKGLEPTQESILKHSPLALVSGLFRPSIFDVSSILMIFVALENLVLFILFIFNWKKILRSSIQEKIIWAYIIILALFLALASPNFGSLTRYKVAFLPFFLFLVLKDNWIISKIVCGLRK